MRGAAGRLGAGLIAFALLGAGAAPRALGSEVVIGSKKFTESVILGEIAADMVRSAGVRAVHRRELGGTRVLWDALRRGDIDLYPEYTGTLRAETLAPLHLKSDGALKRALAERGIVMSAPLGFNDTYALGMTERRAAALGIRTISDLRRHPGLRLGFGNEFLDRADGWKALKRAYRLPQTSVRGLDHDLAYRGLEAGDIDVMDLYSTDAEIAYYGLRVLEDDAGFFPAYDAVYLYRADLARRAPAAVAALARLGGRIDRAEMAAMNRAVKIDGKPDSAVAGAYLKSAFAITPAADTDTLLSRFLRRAAEHLALVGISLGAAILIALPLGILAERRPRTGQAILAVTGMIQTIPALALLVFMIPLLGIGGPPAVVALFLYSLLPIVRNTHAGLAGIAEPVIRSARALGMSPGQRLRRIELPLAAPLILAGIKTSAVINIGTATLGALIGAGGFGQPILTGIRLDNVGLILEGAVPAAALALIAQWGFDALERTVVPRGLRRAVPGA